MDQWYVFVGYSYFDGEIVNCSGVIGLCLCELFENMFLIWFGFQINDQFGFGVGLIYQDESFINNFNIVILLVFMCVDVVVFYDVLEMFCIQLNVENLMDDFYFLMLYSIYQVIVGVLLNVCFMISGQF